MFKNSDMSLEESIERCPMGISREQWASFLEYIFEKRTMEIAEKNTANRAKLTIPHTLGSKSIARRKRELEIEKGRPISRAEFYAYSHLKKDGTFVNEEALQKNDLLLAAQNYGTLSKEEAYVQVFGKEHPGRVRGMGFGPQDLGSLNGFRPSSSASHVPNAQGPELQGHPFPP
ncbi:uncharacterized protein LOC133305996 [Gastrolobium bilobum]|uniref:uncharacterized protein LOC133305996 n=1 Tax=Gastrolobium bilobum TaxID=150636 RepID=UPI002AB2EA45|nr:uncharacterized protein LOC133305996 [Gastrolobium bilobum]